MSDRRPIRRAEKETLSADRGAGPDAPPTPPSGQPSPEALAGILARAARGDEDAWRQLVGLYARRVYALARSRGLSEEVAEDVTQSVFVSAAENIATGGYAERGRFESWLFRVAMNRVRDEARRAKRHAQPIDPAAIAAVRAPASGGEDERLGALRQALARLGDADREIIGLRHHGGLSFKEIAQTLGEPLGTLLARHHRALRKLKDTMAEMTETETRDSE
jgi:RNA polymerase sigma-70 factor (ECF subfamily)